MQDALTPFPERFDSEEALEAYMTTPSDALIQDLATLQGDLMILGAGGKMGPTLTMLAQRAVDEGRLDKRVFAVSRFSDSQVAEKLRHAGVQVIASDLTTEGALAALPDVSNVIYMVGTKFGASKQSARTWAINTFLPGQVAQHFRQARLVAFSSGNVYPLTPVLGGGSRETTRPDPVGEYAMSVLGRERILEHHSREYDTPMLFFRLNYAVEMRYGVLVDIAQKVAAQEPIDLSMGHVNVIWQGDANTYALRALCHTECPPRLLNVTGPEILSVRQVAVQFGHLLGQEPVLEGTEAPQALLSNAQHAHRLFGYPQVPVEQVIHWIAEWIEGNHPTWSKPTKFQVRTGQF
jgi:nucleoside-diphosphate-sugar epimerase